jgi:hypothetical protein
VCPSGLKAKLWTRVVDPVGSWPTCWWLATSHSRTVVSALEVARMRPSALNAIAITPKVWPMKGSPTCWRLATSHSRTLPLTSPVASKRLFGLNFTAMEKIGKPAIPSVSLRARLETGVTSLRCGRGGGTWS